MANKELIVSAEKDIENGYLYDAKLFFTKLLNETQDPLLERIAENRLAEINKLIKINLECFQFHIDSLEEGQLIICTLKFIFAEPHIKKLISDLFTNSHKKNYPDSSSITINTNCSSSHILIEASGIGADERCEWCKVFRKNIIYYIGKKNMVRQGRCPIGFEV